MKGPYDNFSNIHTDQPHGHRKTSTAKMLLFLRNLRSAALIILSTSVAFSRGDHSNLSKTTTPTAQPTCEARTVNYITHTLPQQCLTSAPSVTTASAAESTTTIVQTVASNAETQTPDPELDGDGNDLSTGAFMSFEEWKEMMLQKSGQENLEQRPRKVQDGRGESLGEDYGAIGEEGELSLDFDAYSDKIPEFKTAGKPPQKEKPKEESAVEKVSYDEGLGHVHRSKDAGKTCKERFSYASFDAGATVLKTSPKVKNPKAILVENKDAYMLMECGTQNKFFIAELSDDILVDTVVLANFEFFSSMVRQFRVSVSDRYPAKLDKWKVLGEYVARNSRDIQPFLIENPQIWARYIRIEILSHYGKEFYCPLSLLRVHGTRMLDSWKEADSNDAENELEGEEEEEHEVEQEMTKTEEIAEEPSKSSEPVEVVVEETHVEESGLVDNQVVETLQSNHKSYWDHSYFEHIFKPNTTCGLGEGPASPSQTQVEGETKNRHAAPAKPMPVATAEENGRTTSTMSIQQSGRTTTMESATSLTPAAPNDQSNPPGSNNTSESATSTSSPVDSTQASSIKTTSTPLNRVTPPTIRSKTAVTTSLKPPSSKAATHRVSNGSTSRNKTVTTTSSSAAASPTVQDSFFKQLTKRLQNLESNTTLSMQYIESQSKFLQEALAKLERRHAAKVDLFLDSLNKTVMTELREFRSQYDQIWQSTVIALESQREKFENEHLALSNRVGLLADEVVFQKRMAIAQSILLLGCLVLVIFSRGLGHAGVEFYYPSQLQGSFSRLASPLYPSTPKGGGRGTGPRQPSSVRETIDDLNGATSNRGMVSDSDTNATPPRLRIDRSLTPELRPQTHHHLSLPPHRRPSPTRAFSQGTGLELYQPPTPASLDAGYDSEPPNVLSSSRDGYFSPNTNGDGADSSRERTPADDDVTPVLSPDTDSSQLRVPVSNMDDYANDNVQQPHIMARSSAASLKPLPALPEDPDQISD